MISQRWRDPRLAYAVITAARLAMVARFDLAPDEAYYLTWAHGPAAPDHPPLIAWVARLALQLPIHPIERAVRVVPIVCALATLLCLDKLCTALGASQRARWVLVALSLLPLPSAGGLLLTPDPLLLACVAGIWLAGIAPGKNPRIRAIAIAALGGLAVLAKVHALVVLPSLWLARRAMPDAPSVPRWTFGLAAAVQGVAIVPGLTSLRFQWVHAFTAAGPTAGLEAIPPFPLAGLLIFAAGQIGLLLPALGLLPRGWSSPPMRTLAVLAFVPCAPVLVSALVRIPEPNWSAVGYPALLAAMALASDGLAKRAVARWCAATVTVAFALHLQLIAPWLPLPQRMDPTARLRGWRTWVCEGGPLPAEGLPPYALPSERAIYGPTCP